MTVARILLFLSILPLAIPAAGESFDLRYDMLSGALSPLSDADRATVSDTIRLIKSGEHSWRWPGSSLNRTNPQNSSLRILASYVLLRLAIWPALSKKPRRRTRPRTETHVVGSSPKWR
jgi:hypothetical protein